MRSNAAPPDALRAALGEVIVYQREEWRRERELIEAQSREFVADLRARVVELEAALKASVAERISLLRDGKDGRDGADGPPGQKGDPGEPGKDGESGPAGRDGEPGSPGRDGVDGKNGQDGADGRDGIDGKDGVDGKDGTPGRDGIDGVDGKDGADGRDGVDGAPGRDGADGTPGRDGVDGQSGEPGLAGRDGEPGSPGQKGDPGEPGKDGERGREGPPGKLPVTAEWSDRVHYEAEVVTHEGAAYQALRDTGRAPPGEDWCLIAAAGRDGVDGRSFTIRGTWSEDEAYSYMDVVALGGASFAARRDAPGPCPGGDWQMVAAQGKRGNQGPRGERGEKSSPGAPAQAVLAATVDDEGLLTLVNGDGSTVTCDLYPVLTRIAR